MAHNYAGLYIAVEGIDGSGKSSLIKNIVQNLQQLALPVQQTKEPGGSELGKTVRKILQEQPVPITSKAEYLLFAADRAQHINDIVKPALQGKEIVISDRCGDSSVVYQGYGRGLETNMIQTINSWATDSITPDITFYVKIDLPTARARIIQRNEAITSFEKEQESFFEKIIEGYAKLYNNRSDVVILDGTLSQNDLATQATHVIVSSFENRMKS